MRGIPSDCVMDVQAGRLSTGLDGKVLAALTAPKAAAADSPFFDQLAERIQIQLSHNQEILTVQLKPEALGRLQIKAETSGAGVIATITAESAGVKAYLETNLHQLQQAFHDQGLKVDRISVTVQQGDYSQHPSSGFQDSRSGSQPQEDRPQPGWVTEHFGGGQEDAAPDSQIVPARAPHSTFHTIA